MSDSNGINLKDYIRDIPDFPKEGIMFRDITPLLLSAEAMRATVKQFADKYRNIDIDVIVAAEARGFIFGVPLAIELNAGFVPIRKPGKLPFETHSFKYELEYGEDTLEIHVDGVTEGQNVLVIDDLLATGGTVAACCQLVERCGANLVGSAFLIELEGLNGRAKIESCEVFSLIKY
ncbi:MAG: adenine phosphoribosyltransferase [Pirellulaceae bacterium]|jgi:adenine phosphoribosyltransferase